GWYNHDVSVPFTAADALSGVASTTPAGSPVVISGEGSAVQGSVTVTDVAGNSATFFTAGFPIDKTAPDAPSALDLSDASDSGSSQTDNITTVTTPTFTGTAEAGSTVAVYDGPTLLGTATAGQDGRWTFTVPADRALGDGVHAITARATDIADNTSPAAQA